MYANYDGMNELRERLDSEIDKMVKNMKDAKDLVSKLDNNDYWEGNGFNSYNEKFNKLAMNFNSFCNDIQKLNNNIKVAISNYQEIDKKVEGSIGT